MSLEDLKDFQPLIAAACVFLIGLLTVANTLNSNRLAKRKMLRDELLHKLEVEGKVSAFFSVLQTDINHTIESLETASEIVKTCIDNDVLGKELTEYMLMAYNKVSFTTPTRDWEKLYIVGPDGISKLRRFDLRMADLERSFKIGLSPGEQVPLPLFMTGFERDEFEQSVSSAHSVLEHLDDALTAAQELILAAIGASGITDARNAKTQQNSHSLLGKAIDAKTQPTKGADRQSGPKWLQRSSRSDRAPQE